MTNQDRDEFVAYLRALTDRQVRECYDKERNSSRRGYVALCQDEAARRGISL
jgi:hypothetical protein